MSREMKDSGIEWVGKIPVSWSIKKLNAFYSRKTIKNHPNERVLSVYREYGVIPKDSRSDNHNVTSENTSAYLLVQPTNLVVNKMKAWQGSMGISNHQGIVSPAYFVYQETAVPRERRFFHYLLRSNIYAQEFRRLSRGMREGQWDLTAYDFERTPIIVPPLLEQQQIATFLDIKCSQIDRLSDNIKQQIEELGEYKKALITQAITKGLDPDVEMKDSGIAWVGNMPKEWETVPAKSMFMQRNDKGNKYVLQLLSPTQKFGVIPQSLYEEKTGQNAVKLDEKTNLSALKTVHKGDYCISLRSFQGGFELSDYEGVVSPAYQVFYPIKAVGQRYYKYLFKTQRFINEMNSYTMSLRDGKNIAFADFGKSYIPVPPLSEQKRIGNYLDSKCSQIDALIQTKSEILNVLQEYKKSLIFDYVTGKKEVPVSYRKDGCHE